VSVLKRVVIVDTHGLALKVEGDSLVFLYKGKPVNVHFEEIEEIRITSNVAVSSEVFRKAAEKGVLINICYDNGDPAAIMFPAFYGGMAKTRREQVRAYNDERGLILAKAFAGAAMENRARLLRRLAWNRKETNPEVASFLETCAEEIRHFIEKLMEINGHIDDVRNNIMYFEGRAAEKYYVALNEVIPREYGYEGKRIRRPPGDPFNAAVSYGNSRVRNVVFKSVVLAGLDPFSGFLHADRPGRASMVLDLAEEFLVAVSDYSIIPLFTRRMLKLEDFTRSRGGVYLSGNGRKLVSEKIEERLNEYLPYHGKNFMLRDIILGQARRVGMFLRNEVRSYQPFLLKL